MLMPQPLSIGWSAAGAKIQTVTASALASLTPVNSHIRETLPGIAEKAKKDSGNIPETCRKPITTYRKHI